MDNTEANEHEVPDFHRVMNLTRPVYTLDRFHQKYGLPTQPKRALSDRLKQAFSARNVAKTLSSYVPVLKVVKKYKLKENITGDILAGLTASFLHIPQGLAFGLLASLRPIYGLYTSFFPVLLYVIFGTSPHVSFGTNAIMALLTQTVVEREADAFISGYDHAVVNATVNQTLLGPSEAEILKLKVGTAAACSLLAGLMLALMGVLKLGFLTSYLSTSFIGGFTTAAAVHIATSQLPKILGLKTNSYSGAGKLVLTYIDLFRKIGSTKIADVLIAFASFVVLFSVKIGVNERYKDKMKMPIPIDLIIVVVATLISHLVQFKHKFDVNIVGTIPSGFEAPVVPKLDNAGNFISDAIVMGILSLALTIALAKLMAKKYCITIDDSQELVAYGISNIASSFFSCFPSCTAPPRTMILGSLGSRTTLNGIPTAITCLLVILVLGPLFESLPIAVLAAMIVVSMKDLLLQYRNLPNIWRINRYDFIIWVVTNATAVLLDLDYGLIIGVGVSILLIVVQNQLTSGYSMIAAASEHVIYKTRGQKQNIPKSVAIFRFPVSLYFATAERFKVQIFNEIFNPQIYMKLVKRMENTNKLEMGSFANKALEVGEEGDVEARSTGVYEPNHAHDERGVKPKTVIIDFSMIQYIDMAGVNILEDVVKQYNDLEINVLLTGVTEKAERVLTNAGLFRAFPKSKVLLDMFDALEIVSDNQKFVAHL